MKILVLRKKYISYFFILSLIFIALISILYHPSSFAFELTTNSSIDNSLKEKISSLTSNDEKIAYLTFDDGPTIKSTPKILDILKKENIKATFFVIGKYVKHHPDIVKREYDEGHYIANHGYDHSNKKLYESPESFINEIKSTDKEIGDAIGIPNYCSHIFRFPNGYMSPNNKAKKKEAVKLLSDMNYTYVDWNCLNNDSIMKYTQAQLLNNLKKSSKNKGTLIILMHDTKDVSDTSSVLEASISYLKSQGYEFRNFYDLAN
mgnify:CR=1 FL=1